MGQPAGGYPMTGNFSEPVAYSTQLTDTPPSYRDGILKGGELRSLAREQDEHARRFTPDEAKDQEAMGWLYGPRPFIIEG